jgi:hypothetical protein
MKEEYTNGIKERMIRIVCVFPPAIFVTANNSHTESEEIDITR